MTIKLIHRAHPTELFQYRSTDYVVPGPGKLQLVFTPQDGSKPVSLNVFDFKGSGVAMSMYNTDEVCFSPVAERLHAKRLS
jgi:isocitrate dehydrogenase